MKIKYAILGLVSIPMSAFADSVNVSGSVTAGTDVSANGGHVYAGQYLQSIGGAYVGTFLSVGTTLKSGQSTVSGSYANALGAGTASGNYSSVISGGTAAGTNSVAISGGSTSANAQYSVATSGGSAQGNYSVAMGPSVISPSYACVVLGKNNVTKAIDGSTPSTSGWLDKDPLFAVGNGSGTTGDPNQYRNALTVYKDGTITMSKVQGDISMGVFGN